MPIQAMLMESLLSDLESAGPPLTLYDEYLQKCRDSQKASFMKKFVIDEDPATREAAVKLFLSCNDACATYSYAHRDDPDDTFAEDLKGLLWRCIDRTPQDVGFLTLPELMLDSGTGPGASVGCDDEDFYTKLYDSPLTRTSDLLYQLYRCAVALHPGLYLAELHRSASQGDSIVVGSSLSTVRKTSLIDRTICTEPTLNMFFQKQVGARLTSILHKRFGIDLSKQPDRNRRLAQIGSINGEFATIDLKSASDSISIELCRFLLPPDLFRWLMETRSPYTRLPDGSEVKLEMISSMGNGFTFPLQTLIFSSLVMVCYRTLGIKAQNPDGDDPNWAVFGDDIIVRSDAYGVVVDALERLGFTVNKEKSFSTGNFRESCGGDFFHGNNVRGVYLQSLNDTRDVYSAINRLVRWSARTGIFLFRTVGLLHSLLTYDEYLYIPPICGDAEGIKTTFDIARPALDRNRSARYRYLASVPETWRVPSLAYDESVDWFITSRGRVKSYNPQGLVQALLGGYLTNGRFGIRINDARLQETRVRWGLVLSWNFDPAAVRFPSRGIDWEVAAALLTSSPVG